MDEEQSTYNYFTEHQKLICPLCDVIFTVVEMQYGWQVYADTVMWNQISSYPECIFDEATLIPRPREAA